MLALMDSQTERQYFGCDETEPLYFCASGCGYDAWEPEELHKCIVCQKRFCPDCLISIGGEKFCPDHAKCPCGTPAIASCDDCGAVLCDGCLGDSNYCIACTAKVAA